MRDVDFMLLVDNTEYEGSGRDWRQTLVSNMHKNRRRTWFGQDSQLIVSMFQNKQTGRNQDTAIRTLAHLRFEGGEQPGHEALEVLLAHALQQRAQSTSSSRPDFWKRIH